MKIYSDLTQLIGKTPLLDAQRLAKANGVSSHLLLKLECYNPGGSIKDRVALAMIHDAELKGKLQPGGTIIEPTSGNTGIGLAWIAKLRGYRLILTMPDTMSIERQKLLKVLGAEVELTPGAKGMSGAVARALELQHGIQGSVILQQFENEACVSAHAEFTAQEIIEDTDGNVDVLIAGVGTGGTISGIARTLKAYNPNIHIVAVEPQTSPVLSGGKAGAHNIQGIGAGFIPKIYDPQVVDEVLQITNEEAFEQMRELTRHEGAFCGVSSGAAIAAALKIAKRPQYANASIVTILPDTGNRYLSMF